MDLMDDGAEYHKASREKQVGQLLFESVLVSIAGEVEAGTEDGVCAVVTDASPEMFSVNLCDWRA